MSQALIRFHVWDNQNGLKITRWPMKEDYQTLKDLKAVGFARLKLPANSDVDFQFYEIQNGKMVQLGDGEDEIAEKGNEYLIVDKRAGKFYKKLLLLLYFYCYFSDEAAIMSTNVSSFPSTSNSATPTNSANDEGNVAPTREFNLTPRRPPKMARLSSGPAAKMPTKRDHLGFYFHRNRGMIVKKYEEYKPEFQLMFKTVGFFLFALCFINFLTV